MLIRIIIYCLYIYIHPPIAVGVDPQRQVPRWCGSAAFRRNMGGQKLGSDKVSRRTVCCDLCPSQENCKKRGNIMNNTIESNNEVLTQHASQYDSIWGCFFLGRCSCVLQNKPHSFYPNIVFAQQWPHVGVNIANSYKRCMNSLDVPMSMRGLNTKG
jgi:hypothetical protein